MNVSVPDAVYNLVESAAAKLGVSKADFVSAAVEREAKKPSTPSHRVVLYHDDETGPQPRWIVSVYIDRKKVITKPIHARDRGTQFQRLRRLAIHALNEENMLHEGDAAALKRVLRTAAWTPIEAPAVGWEVSA